MPMLTVRLTAMGMPSVTGLINWGIWPCLLNSYHITGFLVRWAAAVWAWCIVRKTPVWAAPLRLNFCLNS